MGLEGSVFGCFIYKLEAGLLNPVETCKTCNNILLLTGVQSETIAIVTTPVFAVNENRIVEIKIVWKVIANNILLREKTI